MKDEVAKDTCCEFEDNSFLSLRKSVYFVRGQFVAARSKDCPA